MLNQLRVSFLVPLDHPRWNIPGPQITRGCIPGLHPQLSKMCFPGLHNFLIEFLGSPNCIRYTFLAPLNTSGIVSVVLNISEGRIFSSPQITKVYPV